MDQNNQNNPVNTMAPGHKRVGPIVVSLVVVLVLVIVVLYIFASRINQSATGDTLPTDQIVTTTEVKTVTSTADDVQSLSNDLNASVQGLDAQTF
jgi:Tfp pilus assembly protein PilN